MEIKTILDKIRQQEEEGRGEHFFALQISPELVKSAIWTVEERQVKILSLGSTEAWLGEENLLQSVDFSLSSAVEKLALQEETPEPNKVIFGLPLNWVDEDKIIPEKSAILKKISQKLEFSPIGFVVTVEAIVHHLKTTEGIPPTAVLIGWGRKKLSISLVNLGKILGTKLVERSGNPGADLVEGLSRFQTKEPFPTRILLYDNESREKLEETRQELVNYSWQKEGVTFLHLPRVEILDFNFDIKAVALAGGREVAKASGIKMVSPKTRAPKPAVEKIAGFVREKDITIEEKAAPSVKRPLRSKVNLDVFNHFFSKVFPKVKKAIKSLWLLRTKIDLSQRLHLVIGLVLVLLFILGGILIALYWYWPKAEVTLLVEPQVLEKDFTIRLDPSLTMVDKEKLALPAEKVEVILEAEKTRGTTGSKLVGEAAKGEVTIYNGTAQEKTFAAGTVISSSSGIKFTLDEEVTVASQSGTAAEPAPGKATVKVTAVEIGTEGNLAADTEFAIANYAKSDYVAKNESAFIGGTSREIQVVAETDQEKLVDELVAQLKGEAIGKLAAEVAAGKRLVEESLVSKIKEKKFSKEIGEEANEVSLKLKLSFSALSFSEEAFKKLINEEIEAAVPSDFEYQPRESETSFTLKEVDREGVALFATHFKANLMPKLDLEAIKKNLVGKRPEIGEAYLNSLSYVKGLEVKISPRLPNKLVTFPRLAKNIKIEVRLD